MYSMKECCIMTGLSYDTLKFYCNKGLIPNVKRDKLNNYRLFDDDDINWIKSLMCLKKCDFTIEEIKKYIELCLKGKESLEERKQMLLAHRKVVEQRIASLNDTLKFIDWKTDLYDKFMSGEQQYYSYLIKKNQPEKVD